MLQLEHPDAHLHQHQVKAITRGGTQAADDKAMEAYWQALDSGKSKEEANQIFSQTYINVLHGKQKHAGVSAISKR